MDALISCSSSSFELAHVPMAPRPEGQPRRGYQAPRRLVLPSGRQRYHSFQGAARYTLIKSIPTNETAAGFGRFASGYREFEYRFKEGLELYGDGDLDGDGGLRHGLRVRRRTALGAPRMAPRPVL